MPTGYTAEIKNGITFEQFAIGCAKAFGACISLRDEPADAPIPESFEPSDYYQKALIAAEQKLAQLQQMTLDEANVQSADEWEAGEQNRFKRLEEIKELKAKYEAMLVAAEAYQPPTPDHVEFKNFMVEQIKSSIKFDCGGDYYDKPAAKLSATEWLAEALEGAERAVEYHRKGHTEEIDRTNSRNQWIKALRESL
jgi:hypothetical protein